MTISSSKADHQNPISDRIWFWSIVMICFLPLAIERLSPVGVPLIVSFSTAGVFTFVIYRYFPFTMKHSLSLSGWCVSFAGLSFLGTGSALTLLMPLGIGVAILILWVGYYYEETVDG